MGPMERKGRARRMESGGHETADPTDPTDPSDATNRALRSGDDCRRACLSTGAGGWLYSCFGGGLRMGTRFAEAGMVRLGMIGAGHFAKKHVEVIASLGDRVSLALVARRDVSTPFPEAEALGAQVVSADALLEDDSLEAVVVVAPNHLHRKYSEAALRAGKHVFCEKPLAMTVADADAVIAAANETERVLVVGHMTRYVPLYVAAAEVISSGRIGPPVTAYVNRMNAGEGRWWRMNPEIGGGVVFDLLVHDFDLLRWYMGKARSVVARGHTHAQGAYDQIAAIFAYKDGRTAVAEGGLYLRPPCGVRSTLRVVCTRGHIELKMPQDDACIHVFEEGCEEVRLSVSPEHHGADALLGEYSEFLDRIDGAAPERLHLADARHAVACAEGIVKAADTAQEVELGEPSRRK